MPRYRLTHHANQRSAHSASPAFGAVDLYAQQSFLFKYESTVNNFLTAAFFGASLFAGKPMTPEHVTYFRILTGVWTFYFLAKAAVYFEFASRLTLEQGLLARAIIGSASFYTLLVLSITGSKYLFPALKRRGYLGPSGALSA